VTSKGVWANSVLSIELPPVHEDVRPHLEEQKMTNTSRLLATAAVLALLAPAAAKADDHGFYLGGNVGVSIPTDPDFDSAGVTNEVETNVGFAGIAAVGYQFDSNWRVQGEFAARLNNVSDITGTGAGPATDGDVNVYSLMADAIYNVPTGTRFEPYVGVGAGMAWVAAKDVGTIFGDTIDDTDAVFAYQGIAGVEYKVSDRLRAGLDYRYFRTADTKFTTNLGTDVDGEYENHTVTVGLRYLLQPAAAPMADAAPAPVPAAIPAAPQVPNNYIVFFDFDRSALTPEADRILAAAVQNAGQAKVTQIEVTGHADRAGSPKYNQRLSQRRADIVKNALIAKGLTADQIAVFAKGESEPLVATADGVREAQNRRVQVILK